MKRNLITVLLLIFFVILMFGAVYLYNRLGSEESFPSETEKTEAAAEEDTPAPEIGENKNLAPDFSVTDREGNVIHLSDFRGKPVVINFWASWCGPCRSELPAFDAAFSSYGQELAFMMVDLSDGYSETVETASAFVEENDYHFPLFFDSLGEGAAAYGIYAIPCTVIIDAEGQLVTTHTGALSEAALAELIRQWTDDTGKEK